MGFDDFFENRHKHHGTNTENRYDDHRRHDHYSYHSYHDKGNYLKLPVFLEKIRSNSNLKRIVIIGGILIMVFIIALIIVLVPVIIKLFNYISQNGLQGIFDGITGFLDKIWNGSSK